MVPSSVKVASLLLLCALPLKAQQAERPVEAVSLLGSELRRPTAPPAEHEAALVLLRERLAASPDDADALIWVGRRLAYLGRYREAVGAFSEGATRHPADARFLRHRGHRLLTLRRIPEAIADFELGLKLAAGQPDVVEPDGAPNLFNRPTSTLKTNLLYHLGLGHYLAGHFSHAVEAFYACAQLADNPDMWVAAGYWYYLSLRRAGREAEAQSWLAALPAELRLIENDDYLALLRFFRGERQAEGLLTGQTGGVPGATLGYGIAINHQLAGRTEAAKAAFEQVLAGTTWPAFGHLAAEAELARPGPI